MTSYSVRGDALTVAAFRLTGTPVMDTPEEIAKELILLAEQLVPYLEGGEE